MAGLLKMPERADWRNCKLSKDEEVDLVETFKSRFKSFDPNEDVWFVMAQNMILMKMSDCRGFKSEA